MIINSQLNNMDLNGLRDQLIKKVCYGCEKTFKRYYQLIFELINIDGDIRNTPENELIEAVEEITIKINSFQLEIIESKQSLIKYFEKNFLNEPFIKDVDNNTSVKELNKLLSIYKQLWERLESKEKIEFINYYLEFVKYFNIITIMYETGSTITIIEN